MDNRKIRIEKFFGVYEDNFNTALSGQASDLPAVMADSFAACFVASGPQGVMCSQNDESLVKVIREGMDFYRSIGSTSMHVTHIDISPLDDLHFISKVSWRYKYKKEHLEGHIDFEVFYFTRFMNDEIKIFGYITGDEQKALRDKGLIP